MWREEGKLLHLDWQAHTDTVRALAFSPDGRTLATGSWDNSFKLWDIESGTLLWTSWFTENIECLAFAPDGRTVAGGGDDTTIQLWDAHTCAHLQTLSGRSGPVFALAWSPDGHLLASGDVDGDIRLWDATTLFFGVAWSPDGKFLASGGGSRGGGELVVWDVQNGECRATREGHQGAVQSLRESPMAGDWPVAGTTILFKCGIWRAASIYGHCGVTDPTNGSILQGSGDYPRPKRRRCAPWGRLRKRALASEQVLLPF